MNLKAGSTKIGALAIVPLLIVLAALAPASSRRGPTFEVPWHTVDSGGTLSVPGGAFAASMSIGQPDAHLIRGDRFAVAGGFWRGPFEAAIPGDINGDGVVDFDDLLQVLSGWGPCPEPCPPVCKADLDEDCDVDFDDLLIVLANWTDAGAAPLMADRGTEGGADPASGRVPISTQEVPDSTRPEVDPTRPGFVVTTACPTAVRVVVRSHDEPVRETAIRRKDGPAPAPALVNDDRLELWAEGGLVEVDGAYLQTGGATLAVEITGALPVAGHDLLVVSGDAVLGGALSVACAPDLTLRAGDFFVVLVADTVRGRFAETDLPDLEGDLYLDLEYGALPGGPFAAERDLNADGVIDVFDVLTLLAAWDDSVDVTGDGVTDAADLAVVLYGTPRIEQERER